MAVKDLKEVHIGKRGIEPAVAEVEKVIKKWKRVKVRVNRNISRENRKQAIKKIAEVLSKRLKLRYRSIKGRTFILEEVE